ncbi:MAG: AAA family ATPase [Gaiellaceae bacterium]
MSALEAVIVLDGGTDASFIQSALPAGGRFNSVPLSQGAEGVSSALGELDPDLLVVSCVGASEAALEVIRFVRKRHTDCAIVGLHSGDPNGYLERAFAAGIDDLLVLPQGRDALTFAFEKAVARRRGATGTAAALGSLITIVGPKGGTGKTLTACNLAVAFALSGKRPVIVDCDLQFGDVGIALGLAPERTIYDLRISGGSVDADRIEQFLTPHSSGASALLAPVRPDQAGAIDPDFLRQIFPLLRSRHDFVIVDTPPAFSPEVIASIDSATDLCVVGMLDALSLKDTKIGLETLERMGYDPYGVRLVLNRADTSVGISDAAVKAILGRRPDVFVPSDRAVPRAVTDGQAIVSASPKSGPAKAFLELANLYLDAAGRAAPDGEREPSKRRRSLLRKGAVGHGTA